MRHLAISDIHGCLRALTTLLELVNPRADDQLIFLGDYVDKGPDTAGVLALLIELRQRYNMITLRGNHDQFMVAARHDRAAYDDWFANGGDWVFRSYGLPLKQTSLTKLPQPHWQFLERLDPYYELPNHFFVHANVDPNLPLAEQPEHMLYWEKFHNPPPHQSGKIMVCGHTSQRSGLPLKLGHAICIDTRVFDGGWLTCLEVDRGELWQANEQGETRRLSLDTLPK